MEGSSGMGLFDKKNCDICGEKIGIMGNRKLDNGNLCKKCAGKLSPWFEERRHSWLIEKKTRMQYEILRLHVSFQGTDIMYL